MRKSKEKRVGDNALKIYLIFYSSSYLIGDILCKYVEFILFPLDSADMHHESGLNCNVDCIFIALCKVLVLKDIKARRSTSDNCRIFRDSGVNSVGQRRMNRNFVVEKSGISV